MNNLLNARINVYDSDDYSNMVELNFLNSSSCYYERLTKKVKLSSVQLFDMIMEIVKEDPAEVEFNFFASSFIIKQDARLFIKVYHDTFADRSDASSEPGTAGKYDIHVWSPYQFLVHRVKKVLEQKLESFKTHSIVWSFSTASGEINKKEIFLEPQEAMVKEFYPWISEDTVQEYYDNYLKSSETILLLTGVPGTGKTTFIRNLISENGLNADITYDEKLIRSDEFFLKFMNDDDRDILIIEDADTILYDREESDNSLLNKILNISDGLVKNVTKKIIFSTNITDIERIDPALIRPGRCYDVLDFRKLTSDEAQKLIDAKGISKELVNRSYTIAELFSSNDRTQRFNNRRVGF